MDYREIIKAVRRQKKLTVSLMIEQMTDKIHSAAYSRVENLNGNLSLEQYFDICRILGINGESVWHEAKRIAAITELDYNRIASTSENWYSIEVLDDSMTAGKQFSIYPNSVVWYQTANLPSIEYNNRLVVVEDEHGRKHIRELICDFGRDTLRAWNNSYQNIVLQHPYKLVGVVKDVNYRT